MGTALVTGAGGFIAGHVARALQGAGWRVVGLDIRPVANDAFAAHEVVDLTSAPATEDAIRRADPALVMHLAGVMKGADDIVWASNVRTAENVARALAGRRDPVPTVFVGSAAEYGPVPPELQPVPESAPCRPATTYGKAKLEVSAIARRAADDGAAIRVARPFNVIGGGMPDTLFAGAVVRRIRQALAGPPPAVLPVGRTDAIRDFVAVSDVVDALLRIARHGAPGECYNVCTGEGHAIADVLELLVSLAPRPVTVQRDEALVAAADVDVMVGSPAKLRALGWAPRVRFEDSVRDVWESVAPG